jgi:hypothetical protein
MNSDHLTSLPGLLTDAADLLAGLELAGLPPLAAVTFDYSLTARTWSVQAQLLCVFQDEADEIDAIRAWAAALSGEVHLSVRHVCSSTSTAYRRLEVSKALDYGASLHVWTHVAVAKVTAPNAAALAAV